MRLPARPRGRAGRAPPGASAASIRCAEIGGNCHVVGLERPGSAALSLPLACAASSAARSTPIQAPRPGARARTSGATSPSGPSARRISSSRGAGARSAEDAGPLGTRRRWRASRSWTPASGGSSLHGDLPSALAAHWEASASASSPGGVLVLEPVGAGGHDDLVALLVATGRNRRARRPCPRAGCSVRAGGAAPAASSATSSSVARSARSSSVLMPALPSVTSIASVR